ncbi:MAG: AI-2E family transporter [bacterium]|nr:AI-2E family transporter [bacterium]
MNRKDDVHVTVSNKTLVRILVFLIGTILLFRFISNVLHPLTLVLVSAFLAMALNPFVQYVKKHMHIKEHGLAAVISYIIVLVVLGVFFALVLPPFISQTVDFLMDVPSKIQNLQQQDGWLGDLVRRYDLSLELDKIANNFRANLSDYTGTAFNVASRIVANLISIIMVLILTFMMLNEGPRASEWFISQFPERRSKRYRKLATRIYGVVTGFANGQAIIALLGGFFSLIVLLIASSVLNVSINAVPLAALVTLFGLIPTIGSYINSVVITLICLIASPTLAVVMLIYYIVYQQIENATIQPYVQSKTNDLSPLTVFISALLGLGFGGVLGGLVAIPIAATAKIFLEDWLDDRQYNASTPHDTKDK